MSGLIGPRAKWVRAEQQKRVLYRKLIRALDPAEHPVRGYIKRYPYPKPAGVIDPRPWIAYTFVVTDVPTFSSDIGLLLGEVLHNFRGALDHGAWSLVHRRGKKRLTAKEAKFIQFPMARTRDDFWNRTDRLLGVPDDPYRTLIERYQPYRRSTDGEAMRWLGNLTNWDKHRIVLPVVTLPQEGNVRMTYEGATFIGGYGQIRPGMALKKGTEVTTLVLTGVAKGKTKVTVKGRVVSVPIFPKSLVSPPPRFSAVGVEHVLNAIGVTCLKLLDEIEVHL